MPFYLSFKVFPPFYLMKAYCSPKLPTFWSIFNLKHRRQILSILQVSVHTVLWSHKRASDTLKTISFSSARSFFFFFLLLFLINFVIFFFLSRQVKVNGSSQSQTSPSFLYSQPLQKRQRQSGRQPGEGRRRTESQGSQAASTCQRSACQFPFLPAVRKWVG